VVTCVRELLIIGFCCDLCNITALLHNADAQSTKFSDGSSDGRVKLTEPAPAAAAHHRRTQQSPSLSSSPVSSQSADVKARPRMAIPKPSGMLCQ